MDKPARKIDITQLNFDPNKNTIVCGDCCNEQGEGWLNCIPDSSIDLIYIDPPFYSNQTYGTIWGNGYEKRSFEDRWAGGIRHYIEWMKPKIREAKRVLKDTGSIFLHCDWHASHRLRCLLDDVFGEKQFVNEIIWHYGKWTNSPKCFQRNHDNIFFYRKGHIHCFNTLYQPYANDKWVEDTVRISQNGKLVRAKDDKGNYIKRTKENKGVPMHDVFHDISWGSTNKERIGYKTQKPEKLIRRIIQCCTKENDIVLDFFGGGGTTAKVCADLNRRFITGDVSPVAVRVTADRLVSHGYTNYEIKALPSTKKEYLKMNPHKFADIMCDLMGWQANPKKSGDGGIDGFANKGTIPIQIKNHQSKTGRPDIQKFLGAINKYEKGLFVSWGFSPSAYEFKAEIKDKELEFLEVGEILNGLLISDQESLEHKKLYKKRVKRNLGVSDNQLIKEQDIQKEIERSKSKREKLGITKKD